MKRDFYNSLLAAFEIDEVKLQLEAAGLGGPQNRAGERQASDSLRDSRLGLEPGRSGRYCSTVTRLSRERIRNDVLRHRIGVKRVDDGSEEQYRELPFYLPAVFVRESYPCIYLGDIRETPSPSNEKSSEVADAWSFPVLIHAPWASLKLREGCAELVIRIMPLEPRLQMLFVPLPSSTR